MPAPPSRKDLLQELANAYPRQAVPDATVMVYLRALADVPPADLERAVLALIRESRWFPAVSEILERVAELALALPSEPDALAQIESRMRWARLPEHERGDDPGPTVHPLVRETLDRVGGWHTFRNAEDATVIRGQFGRLYRDLRASAIRQRQSGE